MAAKKLVLVALILVAMQAAASAGNYWIDPKHSHIGITVKQMKIFNLKGKFKKFTGNVYFDKENLTIEKADFTVRAGSLDTGNRDRDRKFRTPGFLYTRKFPEITLTVGKSGKLDGKRGTLTGDLTLRGVTRPVEFNVEYLGSGTDLCRYKRISLAAKGKINRTDFGITRQEMIKEGVPMYGDEITLDIKLAGVLLDPTQAAFKCGNYPASRTRM
ncbi:MAG: YceI family protein [Nitrospinota bacterium]